MIFCLSEKSQYGKITNIKYKIFKKIVYYKIISYEISI